MSWQLPICKYPPIDQYLQPRLGIKLDLGCGINPDPGMYGVDLRSHQAKVHCDFTKPLPFASDSIAFLRCMHILEHLENYFLFMDECWRILKDGEHNRLLVGVPRADHWHAYGDPEHRHFFHPNHFLYFTPEWHYDTDVKKWQIDSICWCYANEIRVLMKPLKDQETLKKRMEKRDKLRGEHGSAMLISFQ